MSVQIFTDISVVQMCMYLRSLTPWDKSHFPEACSCPDDNEIQIIVWRPRSPRLIAVRSQMDPVHIFTAIVFIRFNIILWSMPGSAKLFFLVRVHEINVPMLAILSAHYILILSGEDSVTNVRKPSVIWRPYDISWKSTKLSVGNGWTYLEITSNGGLWC
jgi:hypothetical protein